MKSKLGNLTIMILKGDICVGRLYIRQNAKEWKQTGSLGNRPLSKSIDVTPSRTSENVLLQNGI